MRQFSAVSALVLFNLSCGKPAVIEAQEPGQEAAPRADTTSLPAVVEVPPAQPAPEASPIAKPPDLDPRGTGDWAMFHNGKARLGVSSARAISEPTVRWRHQVGIQSWLNAPLSIGNAVIVPSCGSAHNSPDPADGVYALELATGRRIWHAQLPTDANGAAADKTAVYVTNDDGHVYALDIKTGRVLWKQAGQGKMYSHPLLLADRVVVGDAGGHVRAFALKDGAPLFDVQLIGAIRGGASADARAIYVASQDGEVLALTYDGKTLWRVRADRPSWDGKGKNEPIEAYSPPIVSDDALFVPYARDTYYQNLPALFALDKRTGKVKWRARGPGEWGNIRSTPVLTQSALIYAEPYSGDVAAISANNGRMITRRLVGACYFPNWASPAVASELVYVPRYDGVVHALYVRDLSTAWQFYIGDSTRAGAPPTELDNPQACEWEVATGYPSFSPASVAPDGTLLVGSSEGFLYALADRAKP